MDTPAEIQSGISPEIIFLLILLGAVDYTERLGEVTVIFLIPGDSCQAGVGRYSEIAFLHNSELRVSGILPFFTERNIGQHFNKIGIVVVGMQIIKPCL